MKHQAPRFDRVARRIANGQDFGPPIMVRLACWVGGIKRLETLEFGIFIMIVLALHRVIT